MNYKLWYFQGIFVVCYLDVQLCYRMMFTYSCSKLKTFLIFHHYQYQATGHRLVILDPHSKACFVTLATWGIRSIIATSCFTYFLFSL